MNNPAPVFWILGIVFCFFMFLLYRKVTKKKSVNDCFSEEAKKKIEENAGFGGFRYPDGSEFKKTKGTMNKEEYDKECEREQVELKQQEEEIKKHKRKNDWSVK